MSNKTILILGGGLGGIMAAGNLRRLCAPEHHIVVIERNATFSLHMANLWLMTGERQHPEEGERDLSRLADHGIEWVQAEIRDIDPVAKAVGTSAGTFSGDYLVIALGADLHPEAVPGFADAALDLYEAAGALPRDAGRRVDFHDDLLGMELNSPLFKHCHQRRAYVGSCDGHREILRRVHSNLTALPDALNSRIRSSICSSAFRRTGHRRRCAQPSSSMPRVGCPSTPAHCEHEMPQTIASRERS